jgi:hypothetical protein
MAKSNGIKDLKQAAKLLNKHAPDGESLAYINPGEARLLKAHGGSGIETLSGVPSYNWFTDAVGWVVDKGSDVIDWGADLISDRYTGKGALGNVAKDAFSVWGALKAKKDQEGLNAAEMEQFNKLNQQLGEQEAKFLSEVSGHGTTNVPTTIEDVASYTDVTLPTMKTTAVAEGGRIGYDKGTHPLDGVAMEMFGMTFENLNPLQQIVVSQSQNKADLKPNIQIPSDSTVNTGDPYSSNIWEGWKAAQGGRIGYNLGGIGAMDPRIGYQNAGEVGAETTDYNTVPYPMIKEKMKSYADMGGSDNLYDIIEVATQVGDKEFVDYLRQTFTLEGDRGVENPGFSTASGALGAAYGGRIGAQKGGIMPLLNLGGMEKDYRQDGGFVPIGRREKADDVPARLSKNEFVFTADAVRNAGGGDIDKGAQRMYNVMKNLEAGGEISEQSQGQV